MKDSQPWLSLKVLANVDSQERLSYKNANDGQGTPAPCPPKR